MFIETAKFVDGQKAIDSKTLRFLQHLQKRKVGRSQT